MKEKKNGRKLKKREDNARETPASPRVAMDTEFQMRGAVVSQQGFRYVCQEPLACLAYTNLYLPTYRPTFFFPPSFILVRYNRSM